jgi:hypothetical protein
MMIGDARVQMYYSQPKFDEDFNRSRRQLNSITTDWDCFKVSLSLNKYEF